MLIYKKYIIRCILFPLLLSAFSLTCLAWVSQILRMSYLFERGIAIYDFLQVVLWFLPNLLYFILPFSTLYGVLYAYNNLRIHKEIVILENAGISYNKLIFPAIKICFIIAIISSIFSYYLVPSSNNYLKNIVHKFKKNYVNNLIQEGVFNNLSKDIIIFVDQKISAKSFKSVIIFDYREKEFADVIFADKCILNMSENGITMKLFNGQRQSTDKNKNISFMKFDKLSIKIDEKSSVNSRKKTIRELYLWELFSGDKKDLDFKEYSKMLSEGHNRIIWPLYNMILPIISLCIFLKTENSRKNTVLPLVISFLSGIIIVALHFFTYSLSIKNITLIPLMYINFSLAIILSLWHINKTPNKNSYYEKI